MQQALARREELRLSRTHLFGMYRALYREQGQRLATAGTLRAAPDVFYLTETEIATAATETAASANWPAIVAQRQLEFAGYRTETVPGRVVVPSRPATGSPSAQDNANDTSALRGTGCYQGRVSGEALLIAAPTDSLAVAGRIVAARAPTPAGPLCFRRVAGCSSSAAQRCRTRSFCCASWAFPPSSIFPASASAYAPPIGDDGWQHRRNQY